MQGFSGNNNDGSVSGIGSPTVSAGMVSSSMEPSSDVQADINALFSDPKWKNADGSIKLMMLMYLMQKFGAARTGEQAELESHMNKYIQEMQEAWDMFRKANSDKMFGPEGAQLTKDFLAKIAQIKFEINNDPFFKTDAGKGILKSMNENLDSITNTVTGMADYPLPDWVPKDPHTGLPVRWPALTLIWALYNPSLAGQSGQVQGNSGPMDGMMRLLGQGNQQLTGASQIVQANTQVAVKMWQSEQDNFSNFLKQWQKLSQVLIQAEKTY